MARSSTKLTKSSSKSQRWCSVSRTVVLRTILIASLLAAVVICASVSYRLLYDAEDKIGAQTYESIANNAVTLAQSITARKLQGSEVMATVVSHMLPDQADWPFIAMEGYIPIAEKVATLSSSTTQALMVFLDPTDAEKFENHTMQVYQDQGRPNTTGYNEFGFGIWKPDPATNKAYDDGRLHDTSGLTEWGGARPMAVLMMHNKPGAKSHLYNVYSEKDRGVHIDSMMECVQESWQEEQPKMQSPNCAVITDMLELKIRPGPAGLLFLPVFPAHDPSVLVGFATTSIHWEEVLTNVVPDYVSGLTCVVETDTRAYTYEIINGNPTLKGDGDLHDPTYTHLGKKVLLNDIQTGASKSAVYTLTVYPTATMFNTFHTDSPASVALGFFGAIAICTMIFFLYDFLMRRENNQRKAILDVKRRFVRFISHEIRTPLNTVCMGLELLDSELRSTATKKQKNCKNATRDDDIEFWQNITEDMNENAYVAVSILNDLLNYDKLESGDLKLEVGFVNIWNLLERTVNQFNIQAVNKQVDLEVSIERPVIPALVAGALEKELEAGTTLDLWNMYGDHVRLGQVIRNVISNALKFTPPNGTVRVSAKHLLAGLPDAPVLHCEDSPQANHPRAGSIEISINDTGVGLTTEQLKLLFSEGVQFDANRLQHGGGSGLGLSIAKGIVLQHGGTIHAESEGTGFGTTFIMELPLAEFTVKEVEEAAELDTVYTTRTSSETSETDQAMESCQPKRILVVDDAASSRKMLIRLLERAGHHCTPACDGQDAVNIIRDDLAAAAAKTLDYVPIDNVLMDYEMPIIKGPQAAKIMRESGYTKTIIGITGNVLEEDVEHFLNHGADEVFPKPFRLDHINDYWRKLGNNHGANNRSGQRGSSHCIRF